MPHEVEHFQVIEVTLDLVMVVEVEAVVQLGELEDDLDCLGLVRRTQTVVVLPAEDALDALVDEMRADWITLTVQRAVPLLHLWKQNDRSEIS